MAPNNVDFGVSFNLVPVRNLSEIGSKPALRLSARLCASNMASVIAEVQACLSSVCANNYQAMRANF